MSVELNGDVEVIIRGNKISIHPRGEGHIDVHGREALASVSVTVDSSSKTGTATFTAAEGPFRGARPFGYDSSPTSETVPLTESDLVDLLEQAKRYL